MTDIPDVDLFWYQAKPVRVVDGDTVIFEIDLGVRVRSEHSVRIQGVDTAELFSGEDREAGAAAKRFTMAWLEERDTERWPFLLHTHKDTQTFNRYVADVYHRASGESLADALREAGHAIG